jgi:L-serine deaminase
MRILDKPVRSRTGLFRSSGATAIGAIDRLGTESKRKLPQDKAREGLLASAAIGYLCKHNATLSGAEGGCQAEIGVASAISAAFLAQVLDSSPLVL